MSLTEEQKHECEKLFKFLDKDKDEFLTAREVIIGLGVFGKTLTLNEQKKIRRDYQNCDLDSFMNLCAEKVSFSDIDAGIIKAFNVLESKEKPGFISQRDLIFVLKKFIDKVTDLDINEIIKEVGAGPDGYINLENLAREMLLK